MADLYLERIGLVNPTIVERDNNGKIERLESRGLDMASLVAFWRKCFDLDGLLFEKIILHCKSKDFNAMGGRALATVRSVRELLAEQGVECVIDDEWFKNHEVKNEEVEQADRVLTNACNKFAKRAENYENQIKQLRTENKELRKTITEKGEEVFLFTEKDLQARIKKERETAVFNFINRIRFDLGQTYGIDNQLNELTLEDIMENIRNVYKEVYKK
jgi:DNA anti-recombination protein RmuC